MLFAVAAPLDRRRACSANDHSCMPACGRGNGNRNSFIASPGAATALSRAGPRLAVTTATSQPITRGSQIPIAPARRTAVPIPARGFLPRGLSDACPRSARHRQVTGRHLITLNDSGGSIAVLRTSGSGRIRDICDHETGGLISYRDAHHALTIPQVDIVASFRQRELCANQRSQAIPADSG